MEIWRQSVMIWTGALTAAGFGLAVQIVLAHHYDSATFGSLANGYSLAILIATFAFHGVGEVVLRKNTPVGASACLRAAALFLAVGLITGTAWTMWSREMDVDPLVLAAFVPFVIIQSGITSGMIAFQLDGRNTAIAVWPGGFQAVRLGVVIVVVLMGAAAFWVPLGWFLALIPLAWFGFARIRITGRWSSDRSNDSSLHIVRTAFPFSGARLLEFAELQLPIVMAMPLLGAVETGRVAACLAIVQGLLLLPISLFQRLFRARFHDWAETDPARLRRFGFLGGGAMLIAGLALGQAVRPLSANLLSMLFGDDFAAASVLLESLVMIVPIWFASIAVNSTLVSVRMSDLRFGCQIVGILIFVGVVLLIGEDGSSPTSGLLQGIFVSQSFLLVSGVVLLWRTRSTPSRP